MTNDDDRARVWESRAKIWREAFERVRAELEVRPNETVLGAIRRLKAAAGVTEHQHEVAHG